MDKVSTRKIERTAINHIALEFSPDLRLSGHERSPVRRAYCAAFDADRDLCGILSMAIIPVERVRPLLTSCARTKGFTKRDCGEFPRDGRDSISVVASRAEMKAEGDPEARTSQKSLSLVWNGVKAEQRAQIHQREPCFFDFQLNSLELKYRLQLFVTSAIESLASFDLSRILRIDLMSSASFVSFACSFTISRA